MAASEAPWLQGLSDAWEPPPEFKPLNNVVSSASHDANSLSSGGASVTRNRLPRRSLSGLPSSLGSLKSTSQPSTQKRRDPLAPLSGNDNSNTWRRNDTVRSAGARTVSDGSDLSSLAGGTVQHRSKSASPAKKQQTLEWKRRLVQGQLGYGDQTDLFGPSGLENIFAKSKDIENEPPKNKSRMGWLARSQAQSQMPSSPPPWASSLADQPEEGSEGGNASFDSLQKEEQSEQSMMRSSMNSTLPFDPYGPTDRQPGGAPRSNAQDSSPEESKSRQPNETEMPGNRTVSGQTDFSQEDFSPVFISKHTAFNGQVNYAAVDSHGVKKFQSSNAASQRSVPQEMQQESSDLELPSAEHYQVADDAHEGSLPVEQDLSFSENLLTGSPMPDLGQNVELRRGGRSNQGSFRERPLSQSRTMADESSRQNSTGLLSPTKTNAKENQRPTTPVQQWEPKARSSGSPLKLFGDHDTFTNNRLLRRLSQLNPDGTLAARPRSIGANKAEERFGSQGTRDVSGSSFGNGELNGHPFNAEITITGASDSDDNAIDSSPASGIQAPGATSPHGFRFEATSDIREAHKLKRKMSKRSAATSRASTLEGQEKTAAEQLQNGAESEGECLSVTRNPVEGKRPPTSPFKDPTPKRRRTLHASELEESLSGVNTSYHSHLQDAIRRRKSSGPHRAESQNRARSSLFAKSKLMRPRNPTPSQRSRQQLEEELKEATHDFAEQEPDRLGAVMEQIESSMSSEAPPTLEEQAQTLASEVAKWTSTRTQRPSMSLGERKRSVTTQDFLDEAVMVMNLIRSRNPPPNVLGSVEETDAEAFNQTLGISRSEVDHEPLRISRPPSREGSGWRSRGPPQIENNRVISHLRKFQEAEDRDDTGFIADSMACLDVRDNSSIVSEEAIEEGNTNIVVTGPSSDPPHQDQTQQQFESPVSQRSEDSVFNTRSTQGLARIATFRTDGTNSTRKSDNVGTLAPTDVAHLIGEQVGGMTFDREKQRWVRVSRKTPVKRPSEFLEPPSYITSEDDPFREISDLPVDEQKELRRISSPAKVMQARAAAVQDDLEASQHAQETNQKPAFQSRTSSQDTVIPRPGTSDSVQIHQMNSSSAPSRYTGFGSSQQEKVETRATSWSDEELAKLSLLGRAREQTALAPTMEDLIERSHLQRSQSLGSADAAVEKTITPPDSPRSSAEPNFVEETQADIDGSEVNSDDLREDTALDLEESDVENIASPKLRETPAKPYFARSSTNRQGTRQLSLRRQTLVNKFAAAAHHEESEMSLVASLPGDRMMSLSLSVSRPRANSLRPRHLADLQSSPSKGDPSFMLSDLPEFTVHDIDEQRPSERALANRLVQHEASQVNDPYALAVKELVKSLTDVNQNDPYWEDLKQLDLKGRSLASLYGLDEFCTRLQNMDISNNSLTHLHGAPATVRKLDATWNELSSLTSWSHLMNLQYLDASNNRLESLDALASLFHLRELRADDNDVTSINGIFELDGLLKLRLGRNKLQRVNFEGCQLERLAHLDLCGNQITSVRHLEKLASLTELKLDDNNLAKGLPALQPMLQLKKLSLRNCGLKHLDVSPFCNLEHLDVDDNSLSTIAGIHKLKNLNILSMRRQTLTPNQPFTLLSAVPDARTIHLSGTPLPTLTLPTTLLNLRHLSLAATGLQTLPPDFGLSVPNLRTVNLNANSLRDIRPLLNVHKLERLSVASNRLHRLRKSIATLAKMHSLRALDVRDNPLTQGFYVSIAASTLAAAEQQGTLVRQSQAAAPQDEDALSEQRERARYALPAGDAALDAQHLARLDEDTRMRRRVYEILLANSCRGLEEVDGMAFEKKRAVVRDRTWERLVKLGIIRRAQGEGVGG